MKFVSVFEYRFENHQEFVLGNEIFDDFLNSQNVPIEIKESAFRCSDPLCVSLGSVENKNMNLLILAQALSTECVGFFKFLDGYVDAPTEV